MIPSPPPASHYQLLPNRVSDRVNSALNNRHRRRRFIQQYRRKRARWIRAGFEQVGVFGAVALLIGDIPNFLCRPTTIHGLKRLTKELDCIEHLVRRPGSFEAKLTQGANGNLDIQIPREIRAPSTQIKERAVEGGNGGSWVETTKGHILDMTSFEMSLSHASLRMLYGVEAGQVQGAAGEWGHFYREEVAPVFRTLGLNGKLARAMYFIRMVRNSEGSIIQIQVFSTKYRPLFRMSI